MIAPRIAAALLFVALSGATPARAQLQGFEHISSYDVVIDVHPSGRMSVTETIDYAFGFIPRHGMFRTIPRRFHYDKDSNRVYPIRNLRVSGSPGTPLQYKADLDGATATVKIGDPNRTITGNHRYVIAYDVDGAINRFEGHDELYWNAVGHEFATLIERSRVTVRAQAAISQVACFAGPKGSTLRCGSARASGSQATFTHTRLNPFAGVTVVAALPHRHVAAPGPVLEERWTLDNAFSRDAVEAGTALGVLVAGLGMVGLLVSRAGRDRRYAGEVPGLEPPPGVTAVEEPVPFAGDRAGPVEYTPPEGMSAAMMGVLIDEKADPLDVTATIVDLAVRGRLRIEELPRQGMFSRRDWRMTRLDTTFDGLSDWERMLMLGLFRTNDVVEVSDLKHEFHADLAKIQNRLYDEVVSRGWFTHRPDETRGRWHRIGAGVVVAGGALTYVLARWTHYGLAGVAVVLTGVAMLAVHHRMPSRTAKGSAALAQALGFRRYLATAEANQLRFEEQEGVFARYLPYAVVLGETERWARAFGDLGAASPQELAWYSGPTGWSPTHFTDSMSAFSVSTSGTLAATPSSSGMSGFSSDGGGSSGGGGGGGGGSSGGGGGGGGGGSW